MSDKDSEHIRKGVGNRIREVREKRRLTQAEVAAVAGINVNYYAQIERGEVNPSLEKLQGIMKALNIKSLDLL